MINTIFRLSLIHRISTFQKFEFPYFSGFPRVLSFWRWYSQDFPLPQNKSTTKIILDRKSNNSGSIINIAEYGNTAIYLKKNDNIDPVAKHTMKSKANAITINATSTIKTKDYREEKFQYKHP